MAEREKGRRYKMSELEESRLITLYHFAIFNVRPPRILYSLKLNQKGKDYRISLHVGAF